MPGKNIIKQYVAESYYHIYSRGVNKLPTFLSEDDYTVFVSLFKRYLSVDNPKNLSRHKYPNYHNQLELLAYALMPNHLHLFVYQSHEFAIREFMRSLLTSYSMYFNKTYKRVGPVFQSRYRASRITDDAYLQHISRYIHLNPRDWQSSNKTSLDFYTGKRQADWAMPDRILELFDGRQDYLNFVKDYEGQKQILDELKWELANPD
ncbi:MAG: transposase [Candidatus Saccharimonadales bacterium]